MNLVLSLLLVYTQVAPPKSILVAVHASKGTELFCEVIPQERSFTAVADLAWQKPVPATFLTHYSHVNFLKIESDMFW